MPLMYRVDDESSFVSPKILSFGEMARLCRTLKENGKTVGLCHGGFDLLHAGHIKHFESAKKICDVLVVSLTSDRYVSKRKGESRPLFSENLRAYGIANLGVVDYVVVSDYESAVDVLKALQPTYYIKGNEYRLKQTPGITKERAALTAFGGKMMYTDDPKLSSTEIIDYIRSLPQEEALLILDRDGTIIRNNDYFGKEADWKEKMELNMELVSAVSAMQRKYRMTAVVVSNQSGVAKGMFDEARVKEIDVFLDGLLRQNGVVVDVWKYCPDVDEAYARSLHGIKFVEKHVLPATRRKPATDMVYEALASLGKRRESFSRVIVIGDRKEDEVLAKNLAAVFVDITKIAPGDIGVRLSSVFGVAK